VRMRGLYQMNPDDVIMKVIDADVLDRARVW
jgi:hypothetical protein